MLSTLSKYFIIKCYAVNEGPQTGGMKGPDRRYEERISLYETIMDVVVIKSK